MSKRVVSLCFVILLTGVIDCFGQEGSPVPNDTKDTSPGYPVILGDQTLYYVKDIKGPTGKTFSARERAKEIAERIKGMADDPLEPVASINVSSYEQPITLIAAGNDFLMAIFDEDAIPEGRTRVELAAEYGEKIRAAIEKYRRDRSLRWIITGTVYAFIATLVLIAMLYLLNRLSHMAETTIQAWVESEKASIRIQALQLLRAKRVAMVLIGAMKAARFVIFLGIFYAYIHNVLSFFPWTRAFASRLSVYVLTPLRTIGSATLSQIPNLTFLSIIVLISVCVLKLMRLFFNEIERGSITFKGFYAEWAKPTYLICRVLAIGFAAVMAFPYIPGSGSPAFKGMSIFVGVLFSLGSTSAIGNTIAGYMLIYRRVFKIGDRVQIANYVGDVVETRLQVTHLRTIKNEEIIVPNSTIVNSHVMNYSSVAKEKGLILHTKVTIGYDAPWRQVEALLLLAAERTPGLMRAPAPFILQTSLDDFYVSYELNVHTDQPQTMATTYTKLHRNIQDAFNEYGVQIMSPSYRFDPDRPKVVPKDKWYAPPATPLDDPEKKI